MIYVDMTIVCRAVMAGLIITTFVHTRRKAIKGPNEHFKYTYSPPDFEIEAPNSANDNASMDPRMADASHITKDQPTEPSTPRSIACGDRKIAVPTMQPSSTPTLPKRVIDLAKATLSSSSSTWPFKFSPEFLFSGYFAIRDDMLPRSCDYAGKYRS